MKISAYIIGLAHFALFTHSLCGQQAIDFSLRDNQKQQNINTTSLNKKDVFSLSKENINAWKAGKVPVTILKRNGKKIALFQSPPILTSNQLPRFSKDGRYLLILNAEWTLFYQVNPQTYEWNLFDLKRKKTIKRFPANIIPTFSEDSTGVVIHSGPRAIKNLEYNDVFVIPNRPIEATIGQQLRKWWQGKKQEN